MNNLKHYLYYILIGVMSFIAIAFLPMLQSTIDISWSCPQTTPAWILWVASKLSISLLNILIFHCFIKQGDVNTRNNETRIMAEKMLEEYEETKRHAPLSPTQFFKREYGRKIPTVFVTTFLAVFAFGPAVLTFDIIVFSIYLFTVIMAIIMGILEMKKVETYYIKELIRYATYYVENKKKETELCKKDCLAEI